MHDNPQGLTTGTCFARLHGNVLLLSGVIAATGILGWMVGRLFPGGSEEPTFTHKSRREARSEQGNDVLSALGDLMIVLGCALSLLVTVACSTYLPWAVGLLFDSVLRSMPMADVLWHSGQIGIAFFISSVLATPVQVLLTTLFKERLGSRLEVGISQVRRGVPLQPCS